MKNLYSKTLFLNKYLKYKINWQNLQEKNHKQIAKQILNTTNYQVFKRLNLLFWSRMIIKIIAFMILLIIIFVSLIILPSTKTKTFLPFFITGWIAITLDSLMIVLNLRYRKKYKNWRMIYYKSKYIISNQIDFFTDLDFELLELNALEENDFFEFKNNNQNQKDKFFNFSMKDYKKQVIFGYLQSTLIFFIFILLITAFFFFFDFKFENIRNFF